MHECMYGWMDGWMDEYKGTCAQLMLCKVDMLDILHAQHSVPRSLSLSLSCSLLPKTLENGAQLKSTAPRGSLPPRRRLRTFSVSAGVYSWVWSLCVGLI